MFVDLDLVALLREKLVVLDDLVPAGDLSVGAKLEPEKIFRRGYLGRFRRRCGNKQCGK